MTTKEHTAAELELFEEQGKDFRCRGTQDQDLGAVLARMGSQASKAEARAARETDEARVAQLQTIADRHSAAIEAAGATGAERTGAAIATMNQAGQHAEAALLDKMARAGCGQDLREVIAALPRPCEDAEYTCPKCGRVGRVTKTALPEPVEA